MYTRRLSCSNIFFYNQGNNVIFESNLQNDYTSPTLHGHIFPLRYVLNLVLPSDIVIIGKDYDSLILARELNKNFTSKRNIIIIDPEPNCQREHLIYCQDFFKRNPDNKLSSKFMCYKYVNSELQIEPVDCEKISVLEDQLVKQLPTNIKVYNVEEKIDKEVLNTIVSKTIIITTDNTYELSRSCGFNFENKIFETEKDERLVNRHRQAKQFNIFFTVPENIAKNMHDRLRYSYTNNQRITYMNMLFFSENKESNTTYFSIIVSAYNLRNNHITIREDLSAQDNDDILPFIDIFLSQLDINDIISESSVKINIESFSIPEQKKATNNRIKLESGSDVFLFGAAQESNCYLLGNEIKKVYSSVSDVSNEVLSNRITPSRITITLEDALKKIKKTDIVIVGGGPSGLILAKELSYNVNTNIFIIDYKHVNQRNEFIGAGEFFKRNPDLSSPIKYVSYKLKPSVMIEILSSYLPISWLEDQLLSQLPHNAIFYSVDKKIKFNDIVAQIPAKTIILSNGADHRLAESIGFTFRARDFESNTDQQLFNRHSNARQFKITFVVSKSIATIIHKLLQDRYILSFYICYYHTTTFIENEDNTVRFYFHISAYNIYNDFIAIPYNHICKNSELCDNCMTFINAFLRQIDLKDIITDNNIHLDITNFSAHEQNIATTNDIVLENGSKVFLFGDARQNSFYFLGEGIRNIYSSLEYTNYSILEFHSSILDKNDEI